MKFKIIERYWTHGTIQSLTHEFKTYSEAKEYYDDIRSVTAFYHQEIRLINLTNDQTLFEYRSW